MALIDQVQLDLLIQQWQLVQHSFSENLDKVDELNTTVQRLSSSLQVEQMFSVGLNRRLGKLSESVNRRLDAIDQTIKERLVIERKGREEQFQALAQIVSEFSKEFQTQTVTVIEEGLLREKTARDDSNAQLRKIIDAERAVRRKMQRELVCEKEAREQMRDRMGPASCCSGAQSCSSIASGVAASDAAIKSTMSVPVPQLYESARELMQFGTAPKLRSEAGVTAAFATAVANASMPSIGSSTAAAAHRTGSATPLPSSSNLVPSTGGTSNIEEDCQLQAAEKRLTAGSGNPPSLTGTWQFNSENGWTRFSLPAVQLETKQQQQQQQPRPMVRMVKPPLCSGASHPHNSSRVVSLRVSTPRVSADWALLGISPKLVPSMLEVTQLQVQQQHAQVQQQPQLQQHQVHQQVRQQQQTQQPQRSQKRLPLSRLLCTLSSRTQRSSMPFNSLDLPEREQTV